MTAQRGIKKRRPVMQEPEPSAQLTAWSYSRLSQYESCPKRAYYQYVVKLPEEKGPPLIRGQEIHGEAEAYLKAKKRLILPKSLSNFKEWFEYLRTTGGVSEAEWAFTSKWTAVGWFEKQCWLRAKVDYYYFEHTEDGGCEVLDEDVLVIIDFKTGKPPKSSEDYQDQLNLYATVGFAKFPEINTIRTELWYLDHGISRDITYLRKHYKMNQKIWEARAAKMLREKSWQEIPSFKCGWCPFNAKKNLGAPCTKGR